jgi:hypothetical protein
MPASPSRADSVYDGTVFTGDRSFADRAVKSSPEVRRSTDGPHSALGPPDGVDESSYSIGDAERWCEFDIDPVASPGEEVRFVHICDAPDDRWSLIPGADIDAVGAVNSIDA